MDDLPRTATEFACEHEAKRIALETIVSDAIELVKAEDIDPFDAADWVASKYNYADVQVVLRLLREEMDRK